MYDGPVHLLSWVEDNIHPQKLTSSLTKSTYVLTLKEDFAAEFRLLKKNVFNQLIFSRIESAASIKQVVKVSDIIYHYFYRLTPLWNQSVNSGQIRSFYVYALTLLQGLLEDFGALGPEIYREIPLTKYIIAEVMREHKIHFKVFSSRLEQLAIDADLKNLVKSGIYQLINHRVINSFTVEYCRKLMATVSNSFVTDNENFKELLLLNGFNLPEFYLYCINDYKFYLKDLTGLHEQLEMVTNAQDRLNSLPAQNTLKMFPNIPNIDEQLHGFLSEKRLYIKEMLELRRTILRDDQLAKSMIRLKINLPVAQFALFIRVQIEKGLLMKENVGELFSFFATHFYTPQTLFISAESLRKKSTDVEFATAQKLKANIIAMLNWLNEHYNLNNYKES